jgi:hypothetical protein
VADTAAQLLPAAYDGDIPRFKSEFPRRVADPQIVRFW